MDGAGARSHEGIREVSRRTARLHVYGGRRESQVGDTTSRMSSRNCTSRSRYNKLLFSMAAFARQLVVDVRTVMYLFRDDIGQRQLVDVIATEIFSVAVFARDTWW